CRFATTMECVSLPTTGGLGLGSGSTRERTSGTSLQSHSQAALVEWDSLAWLRCAELRAPTHLAAQRCMTYDGVMGFRLVNWWCVCLVLLMVGCTPDERRRVEGSKSQSVRAATEDGLSLFQGAHPT